MISWVLPPANYRGGQPQSQKIRRIDLMDLQKILSIPKRVKQDLQIIGLAKNWKEILASKLSGKPLRTVRLRNGVMMNEPAEVNLGFLFHEIWLDKFYEASGVHNRGQ